MTDKTPTAGPPTGDAKSVVLDASSVLTASVKREKAAKGADLQLIELLETTILRVDAADSAWEKAAAAIVALSSSRAASRMGRQ